MDSYDVTDDLKGQKRHSTEKVVLHSIRSLYPDLLELEGGSCSQQDEQHDQDGVAIVSVKQEKQDASPVHLSPVYGTSPKRDPQLESSGTQSSDD